MSLPTQHDVDKAETAYLKLKAEYDALSQPVEPKQLRQMLTQFAFELQDANSRLERIEKILIEIQPERCEQLGLKIIPF